MIVAAFAAAPTAAAPTVLTVVSVTFDDGVDSQAAAAQMLAAHGMGGTFYVNSDTVGTAGHLTWSNLAAMAAGGHEVAGHTLDHVDLTTVSTTEAQRQVCEDRARFLNHGFGVSSFAYPFGAGWHDSTIRTIVQQCGYNSGRGAWGLRGPDCTTCTAWQETIPPADLWAVRTSDNARSTTTAETIESYVTGAETHGGGWVILVFHHICDGCENYSTSAATLQAVLDWLQPRAAQGTTVKTVQQVIGGSVKPSPGTSDRTAPVSSISCNGGACSSTAYSAPVTVSLAASDSGGSGLEAIRYTTDGSTPTLTSTVYTGPFTVSSTTTVSYRAWDNAGNAEGTKSQVIPIGSADTTPPTTTISCNGSTCSSTAYAAPVQVTLSSTDVGSGVAAIRYTTDGSDPTAASTLYTGPFTVSTTTTVKYRAWDNAGNAEASKAQLIQISAADTTPPTSSIACNGTACSSTAYTAPVQVTLSSTDAGSGVAAIRYTMDGSDPTAASTLYTGPFTVSTTTTVKYRAWDNAGNAEASKAQLIQITAVDATPPTSSISCNGGGCSTGWYASAVRVTLSATDTGGSGVAAIRYTTDGSDPTASSTLYTAPFTVSTTTTVKYRAWDNAGNPESTRSQLIQIDSNAPSVAITSPANGATVNGTVQVQASASDAASGVAQVAFYLDGQLASTATGGQYKFAWNTKKVSKGQHVLTAVATDRAGNATTSATVSVTVQ